MKKHKAIFCWSGGKDSAYCLHKVLSENFFEICYLLTTFSYKYKRVSMHGVREELIEKQAESIGVKLLKVYVSEGSNEEYERQMEKVFMEVRKEGITKVIFGDIFLEDLRKYREKNLEIVKMQAVFPLWKTNTRWLVNNFLSKGFKTIVSCVSDRYLDEKWVGREIDATFIKELPEGVDFCGENGEFHTFCYEGPLFKKKINLKIGKKIYMPLELKADQCLSNMSKTMGFWYCDLKPL